MTAQDFEKLGVFYLGRPYDLSKSAPLEGRILYNSKDLVTHAVCIGMTGSGKTGLCLCILEEAAIDNIPSIVIDPKGDITNLLLTFPNLRGEDFAPWVNEEDATKKGISVQDYASQQAELWRKGLSSWGEDGARIKRLRESADFVIYTPGSNAGLPISILRSFSAPQTKVAEDNELLQERISTTVTSLLGLVGIEADPMRSKEHILISTIFNNAWKQSQDLNLPSLIQQVQSPALKRIGVLDLESFYPSKERFTLAMQLNNLLAAPGFQLWLEGDSLNIDSVLHNSIGKPKISIFYIAHLNDAERMFFVSLLLNEIVGWMRAQSGTTSLRTILYMDEVFGYLPPTANPPSKMPMLTLLKQARAFGLGIVLATQNPVDLDYKALSNTGTWFIGRLQTERDKMRVLEALEGVTISAHKQFDRPTIDNTLSALKNRIFLMHNVHEDTPVVFETRWPMSYLRGPLTRDQIKVLMDPQKRQMMMPLPEFPSKVSMSTTPSKPRLSAEASQRPVLPPEIPQYFVPVKEARLPAGSVSYRPMILGVAQVRLFDSKKGIDVTRDAAYLVPVTSHPVPVDWEKSIALDMKLSDLTHMPAEPATFSELPSVASESRNYARWQRDFGNWLLKTQKLELRRSPSLNELSRPEEAERDFRIRLQQVAREKRDSQVENLRQKYASRVARLDLGIHRAQEAVEREALQTKEKEYQTAVSLGATILGSFLGRKSLGGATRTARDVGRTMKEKQDIAEAEADLKELQKERADLEAQFQSEVQGLDTANTSLTENLVKSSF